MPAIKLEALPPEEAIDFFRQKGYQIGFDWRDVWQQEHQAAFTVAKAMQFDILRDIRAEVDAALANGTTLADFRKRLQPRLMQKGWWGRADMQDPVTGEVKNVQLGSTRRLKTIYDTNLRTAHSEGQWERIQASKQSFPYLQYDGNNSEHPRLQHAAWDGLVLPVDDPFWQSHMPIKEWGCKCRVIQMTGAMLERRGLTVSESPKVPTVTYINQRTGEALQIPEGVHPAFHYPPGGRRDNLGKMLASKLDALPAPMRHAEHGAARVVGDVSDEFRTAIDGALGLIPENVRAAVFAAGYQVKIANMLVDIKPELAGVRPRGYPPGLTWEHVDGGTFKQEKIIAIAQTSLDPKTGNPFPVNSARGVGAMLHEYGHAVDDVAKLAADERFIRAYNADLGRIDTAKYSATEQDELAYMMQGGVAGPQEVFAECFARLHGGSTALLDVTSVFQDAAAVVKAMIEGFGK